MQGPIIKFPGTYDELDIRCPKCNSNQITVSLDSRGHYAVIECNNCNYKKGDKI
jgi:transcription elongation factor Elf1